MVSHPDISLGWLPSSNGDLYICSVWYAGELAMYRSQKQCHSCWIILHAWFIPFQLFSTIYISSVDDPDGSEITDYNNFSNFFQAVLVMIR